MGLDLGRLCVPPSTETRTEEIPIFETLLLISKDCGWGVGTKLWQILEPSFNTKDSTFGEGVRLCVWKINFSTFLLRFQFSTIYLLESVSFLSDCFFLHCQFCRFRDLDFSLLSDLWLYRNSSFDVVVSSCSRNWVRTIHVNTSKVCCCPSSGLDLWILYHGGGGSVGWNVTVYIVLTSPVHYLLFDEFLGSGTFTSGLWRGSVYFPLEFHRISWARVPVEHLYWVFLNPNLGSM